MKKNPSNPSNPEDDKELLRAFINSFQSPENDDHISLEGDNYFENIYGKEGYAEMKSDREKKVLEEKKRLG
ncbi:hypothetical protein DFQ04_3087 [Algoriphagus boseongensis]|uniref:Uncharacterized protein n=1 Tax=Algoriphagus boseongensis TaxID=1442587 RepID=A0A4R6T3W3_9BACT|nr:hypothetical protein [Algoriphagus boseongensis]TDQ15201.1 hypothetical protein DFQ04_3087 [Algoriphagus boseongensis]